MSIFAYNLLNRVISELEAFDPAQILTKLDITLAEELYRHANINSDPDCHSIVKAGMEMNLLVFDHQTNVLTFSGANRPLFFFRDGVLKIIKGDRYPIGYYLTADKTFTKHTLQIQKGDRLYVFTDGITDQFGGEKHVKYSARRLGQFLVKHADLTLAEQMFELNLEFHNWKRQYEQTDDISFIGIEPCR